MCTSRKVRPVSIREFVSMLVPIFINFNRLFIDSHCPSFDSATKLRNQDTHFQMFAFRVLHTVPYSNEPAANDVIAKLHSFITANVLIGAALGWYNRLCCLQAHNLWSFHFSWFFNNHISLYSNIVSSIRRKTDRLHGSHGLHSVVDSGNEASKYTDFKHLFSS